MQLKQFYIITTKVSSRQVLELMQMHPKERLGRGYFDSQLV